MPDVSFRCNKNMKIILLTALLINSILITFGQTISSHISIATVYSQNGKYYLKTIPYDNQSPSLRGKTYVYETGFEKPLYMLERAFDTINENSNELILSNNGELIFYVISSEADEEKEGLKSINIYKKGALLKSWTASDVTKCDFDKERCDVVFDNFWDVLDKEKSNFGTAKYKRVFKDGVSEQDKFLADFAVFSVDDTVYLTDSKKQTHLFDLKEGNYLRSMPFETIFPQIKDKGRFSKINIKTIESPYNYKFPAMNNGIKTEEQLASFLGMKTAENYGKEADIYKIHTFKVKGVILRDGTFETEDLERGDELPKEKILEFFRVNKFNTDQLPPDFEKYYIEQYFTFRNKDDKIARQEKISQDREYKQAFKERLVAEKINGVYIPKDLAECFAEMDKQLKEINKKEMQSLPKRSDMIKYHMGLGMWMRNNWGLWGGSRLQKYFTDKGITHPDNMSSVILFYYYDWLNGKKDAWKDWEKNPKQIYEK